VKLKHIIKYSQLENTFLNEQIDDFIKKRNLLINSDLSSDDTYKKLGKIYDEEKKNRKLPNANKEPGLLKRIVNYFLGTSE